MCTCAWYGARVEIREQLTDVNSFFPLCGSQGLDAGNQAWKQILWPAEPATLYFMSPSLVWNSPSRLFSLWSQPQGSLSPQCWGFKYVPPCPVFANGFCDMQTQILGYWTWVFVHGRQELLQLSHPPSPGITLEVKSQLGMLILPCNSSTQDSEVWGLKFQDQSGLHTELWANVEYIKITMVMMMMTMTTMMMGKAQW